MSHGIRNPARNALISLVILVVSVTALVAGIVVMISAGRETTFSAIAIGLGALGSILSPFLLINFVWGMRLVGAMRRGENVIGRWTVAADQFKRFRANEARHAREGHPNVYTPPRRTPAEGVEIIFTADAVLIGDTFFGLATTGVQHIRQAGIVPGDPLCLGFQTAILTGRQYATGVTTFRMAKGLLRIPVPDAAHADAKRVLDHYTAALAGQVVVKPDFWPRRIRWGLWVAGIAGIVAAAGFVLEATEADSGVLPVVLAVSGTVTAVAGLVLALIAWSLAGQQRRGRRSDGSPA